MSILYITADLMFSSRVVGAAKTCAVELVVTSPQDAIEKAASTKARQVILDLGTPNLDVEAIVPKLRASTSEPITIIAYGPHVQEAKLIKAQSAGCDQVLTRGQFNSQIDELLRKFSAEK